MRNRKHILQDTAHRTGTLPLGQWAFYQEWNDALFMHWQIPVADLQHLVPKAFPIDTYEGSAWISIVAFTMQRLRPRGLPHVSLFSDFHEINLRTYVIRDGKPGVYFLTMEGSKRSSVYLSRTISGLPYINSLIERSSKEQLHSWQSSRHEKDIALNADFVIGDDVKEKTALDKWLTERYCLYYDVAGKNYRFDIHHKEWPLQTATLQNLKTENMLSHITGRPPDITQYSKGVQVLAWQKIRLD